MKIRIVKDVPGCVFNEGQVIRVGDRQAQEWIRAGAAVPFDGVPGIQPIPVVASKREKPIHNAPPPVSRPSAHMLPPRWIAPDGRVFKNQDELDAYVRK